MLCAWHFTVGLRLKFSSDYLGLESQDVAVETDRCKGVSMILVSCKIIK